MDMAVVVSIRNKITSLQSSEDGTGGENWRTYSQESTLHGIKYIGKTGLTLHRK